MGGRDELPELHSDFESCVSRVIGTVCLLGCGLWILRFLAAACRPSQKELSYGCDVSGTFKRNVAVSAICSKSCIELSISIVNLHFLEF